MTRWIARVWILGLLAGISLAQETGGHLEEDLEGQAPPAVRRYRTGHVGEAPEQPGQDRAGGDGPPFPLSLPRSSGTPVDSESVKISGDSTIQVGKDELEFSGNVKVKRQGVNLFTDRIRYDRTRQRLMAVGNVTLEDPLFSLSCGKLTLYVELGIGVAWESPRLTQARKDAAGQITERTEINALQLTFHTTEDRVEGLERVRIYRWIKKDAKMELDFKITADALDANLLSRRSVLKGKVRVESPTYVVKASRLIFDQTTGRFIAIGDARVEGFDEKGQVANVVEGSKLIHFIREGRTIIIGAVSGVLDANTGHGEHVVDVETEEEEEQEIPILPLKTLAENEKTDRGKK